MNKYGIENFIIEELEQVKDENLLSEREIYWKYDLAGNYIQTFFSAQDAIRHL